MVDGVEGLVVDDCESAGGEGADKEGAEEAWGVGDGDGVDILPGAGGVFEGFVDDGLDGFEVGAGSDFRDDSAIFGKDVDLGDDDVAQNVGTVFDDGGGGFVAAGFNP